MFVFELLTGQMFDFEAAWTKVVLPLLKKEYKYRLTQKLLILRQLNPSSILFY